MKLWNERVLCDLNAGERWHEVAEGSPPPRVQAQGPWETNTAPIIPTRSWRNYTVHVVIDWLRACMDMIQLVFNSVGNTRIDIFLPHYVECRHVFLL